MLLNTEVLQAARRVWLGGPDRVKQRGYNKENPSFDDMKSATTRTFSGLASFDVDLYSSSYSDDSRITVRDTNSGDRLEMEGITNAVLRGAVLSYVSHMGYRKEDASARKFLEELSDNIARSLEKEEA